MPLIDITNPRIINFLVESYDKEATTRFFWNLKNKDRINDAATLKREFTNYFDHDIMKSSMAAGMAATTRDHIAAGRHRRTKMNRDGHHVYGINDLQKGHSIVDMGLGTPEEDPRLARPEGSLERDPIMRPVDPDLTAIIYQHLPGRQEYLNKRVDVWPEKKFYFAECVNWDYGWRMKDSLMKQGRRYGRHCVLTNSFKTNRVGPQPDPPHYKSSDPPGVAKCIAY